MVICYNSMIFKSELIKVVDFLSEKGLRLITKLNVHIHRILIDSDIKPWHVRASYLHEV